LGYRVQYSGFRVYVNPEVGFMWTLAPRPAASHEALTAGMYVYCPEEGEKKRKASPSGAWTTLTSSSHAG